MKQLKRTLSLALSIVMLLSMCVTANAAYTPAHTEDADILYELGLFKGMGSDANGNPVYGLEQKATRIQGIVMLLHLLGEEADAQVFEGTHPFTDVPAWGDKHIAYTYAKGYTAGTSATTFGSDSPLVGKAYATFVLKALGYDANSDFSYNTALEKAAELGLIQAGDCDGELYRDHCVMMSRNALRTNIKDSDQKLVEKLLDDGVVSTEAVQQTCILNETVIVPRIGESVSAKDICAAIPDAACIASSGTSITENAIIPWNSLEQQKILLLQNRYIKDYASGESDSLKKLVLEKVHRLYSQGIITVLDKDYNLIAYCVYGMNGTDNKLEDSLIFTTCFVKGKPEIERVRNLMQNVQSFDVESLFYKEIITTIHPDGSENIVAYLRMNENEMPAFLKENAVYFGGLAKNTESFYQCQISLEKYAIATTNGTRPVPIRSEVDLGPGPLKSHYGENFRKAFYDENMDFIGYITQSNDITANEVHTIIDLREG